MAINIKELFDADSDNIKVEKTNYNFDQILANGGGPVGPKGVQGTTGNTGQKGTVGDKGDQGVAGDKGDQGVSLNIWDKDTMTGGLGDLEVLRPFNNASENITRVILGEDTVNDTSPTYLPGALLSLILPSTVDEVSNQIELKYDDTDARNFYIRSEYEGGTGTTLIITGAAAAVNEVTSLNITIPNSIQTTSNELSLLANQNILINNLSQGDITIGNLSGETVDVFVYSDNLIRLETDTIELAGDQVYVTGSDINLTAASGTIDLSADTNTLTGVVKNELISATGENSLSSGKSGLANILNTTGVGGINVLQNSGVDKFQTSSDLNTSSQNIFFNGGTQIFDGTPGGGQAGADYGDGIQFLEGGPGESLSGGDTAEAAANNGSTINERTLNDYFVNRNVDLWSQSFPYTRVLEIPGASTRNWYTDNGWDSLISDLPIDGSNGSPNVIYNNWGSFDYTKIGNIIHGFGSVRFSGTGQAWQQYTDFNRETVIIDLNCTGNFPFLNDSNSPAVVDVSFGGNSYQPSGNNPTVGAGDISTGEWDNPNSYIVTDNALIGLRDIVKIKGVIVPGRNEIVLLYDSMNAGFNAVGNAQNDIDTLGLAPAFFSAGYPVCINFSFSMVCDWNSYNRIVLDTGAPPDPE